MKISGMKKGIALQIVWKWERSRNIWTIYNNKMDNLDTIDIFENEQHTKIEIESLNIKSPIKEIEFINQNLPEANSWPRWFSWQILLNPTLQEVLENRNKSFPTCFYEASIMLIIKSGKRHYRVRKWCPLFCMNMGTKV